MKLNRTDIGIGLLSIAAIALALLTMPQSAATVESPMTTYHGHEIGPLDYEWPRPDLLKMTPEEEILYIDPLPQQTECLALNIYYESGNQPLAGKLAVAHVTMNRMWHRSYPNTICGVVYQAQWRENWRGVEVPVRNKCHFSWFCDGKSDIPTDSITWDECVLIATNFLDGPIFDFTEGSTHYHSDAVSPYWNSSLNETVVINNHIFYK
jgi:N-acetylmuramoyl-L-alanine amidase